MMSLGRFETAGFTRSRKLGAGIRVLGLLVLGCSAASATAFLYPAGGQTTEAARPAPRLEKVSFWAALAPAKDESRPAIAQAEDVAAASAVQAKPAVRQIPLTGGVDPTPPTPPKIIQAAVLPSSAAALQAPPAPAAQAPAVLASNDKAPTSCLSQGLRSVLQDVQARFGPVTLVSTTELHTDNHAKGSVRHKLHGDCQAVDFKINGELNAVTAYLRTRSEVAGINTYKNNRVIHMDAAQTQAIARR
jgi:hypothetical protein